LLTNVPKPRGPIPVQLDRIGVPRDAWDAIVTSGDAIRAELRKRAPGPMYKIGPAEFDASLWEGLGLHFSPLREAAFIGISGLDDDLTETPASYKDRLEAARARDLEMVCANPDIVVRVGDRLVWCAGAVARDYAALGGRVVMAGKPHAPIYDLAYAELEAIRGERVPKRRLLAIGDGAPTDVLGAARQGLDCLFVADGVNGADLQSQDGGLDLEKVSALLRGIDASATYVTGGLA
jgi:HAD superfamily hydrolase (TIGR01459 family)